MRSGGSAFSDLICPDFMHLYCGMAGSCYLNLTVYHVRLCCPLNASSLERVHCSAQVQPISFSYLDEIHNRRTPCFSLQMEFKIPISISSVVGYQRLPGAKQTKCPSSSPDGNFLRGMPQRAVRSTTKGS